MARGFAVLVHDGFLFGSRKARPLELPPPVVERMMTPPLAVRELKPGDADSAPRQPTVSDVSPQESPGEIRAYDAFTARHEDIIAKSLSRTRTP